MDSFDTWDYSSRPDVLRNKEIITIDDESLHVTEAIFYERILYHYNLSNNASNSNNNYGYQMYDVRVNMELMTEIENIDFNTLENLYSLIYYDDETEYYTLFFTSRNWRKCEYYDDEYILEDYTLSLEEEEEEEESEANNNGRRRRRLGERDEIEFPFEYEEELTNFEIFGAEFAVELREKGGIGIGWEDKDDPPDGPEEKGASWFVGLLTRLQSKETRAKIDACANQQRKDYADCNSNKESADEDFESCIYGVQDENDDDNFSIEGPLLAEDLSFGIIRYFLAKTKYCRTGTDIMSLFFSAGIYLTLDDKDIFSISLDIDTIEDFSESEDDKEESEEKNVLQGRIPLIWGMSIVYRVGWFYGYRIRFLPGIDDENTPPFVRLSVAPSFSSGLYAEAALDVVLVQAGLRLSGTLVSVAVPISAIFYNLLWNPSALALGLSVDFEIHTAVITFEVFLRYVNGIKIKCCFKISLKWSKRIILYSVSFALGPSATLNLWSTTWGNVVGDTWDYKLSSIHRFELNYTTQINQVQPVHELPSWKFGPDATANKLGLDETQYRSGQYDIEPDNSKFGPGFPFFLKLSLTLLFNLVFKTKLLTLKAN